MVTRTPPAFITANLPSNQEVYPIFLFRDAVVWSLFGLLHGFSARRLELLRGEFSICETLGPLFMGDLSVVDRSIGHPLAGKAHPVRMMLAPLPDCSPNLPLQSDRHLLAGSFDDECGFHCENLFHTVQTALLNHFWGCKTRLSRRRPADAVAW